MSDFAIVTTRDLVIDGKPVKKGYALADVTCTRGVSSESISSLIQAADVAVVDVRVKKGKKTE